MKESLRGKLQALVERLAEIGTLLSDPNVIADQNRFRDLSREYSRLEPITRTFDEFSAAEQDRSTAEEMRNAPDPELHEMAEEELVIIDARLEALEQQLKTYLLPEDPHDQSNIFLEIRAGTGGDEAAIFAGDLYRMYLRFAETQGWKVEVLSESEGDHGGYKEIISRIVGRGAYSQLKFESGAHRVQRVPATESQGRIHTSACTVAVLPEVEEVDDIEINPADLRIDTFRSSGAGGQHVNTTDSAVRITHDPTGIVVECQDERSQHKNRARAMSLLKAKMLQVEKDKQQAERAATRKSLVGSGDRSERIRTYNYPQGRITDHRIGLTLYKLEQIIAGELGQVIEPLTQEFQAEQLAELAESP